MFTPLIETSWRLVETKTEPHRAPFFFDASRGVALLTSRQDAEQPEENDNRDRDPDEPEKSAA